MVHIKPHLGFVGNHVYASNGEWAFDHNGWTRETELVGTVEKAYRGRYPEWDYEKIIFEQTMNSLDDFCRANNHRLPWQYAYLPWERADKYIKQFPDAPPED